MVLVLLAQGAPATARLGGGQSYSGGSSSSSSGGSYAGGASSGGSYSSSGSASYASGSSGADSSDSYASGSDDSDVTAADIQAEIEWAHRALEDPATPWLSRAYAYLVLGFSTACTWLLLALLALLPYALLLEYSQELAEAVTARLPVTQDLVTALLGGTVLVGWWCLGYWPTTLVALSLGAAVGVLRGLRQVVASRRFEQVKALPPDQRLRALDDRFSRVVFLDLVTELFHRVQRARASGDLEPLAPYLGPYSGLPENQWDRPEAVEDVVVGGIRIEGVVAGVLTDRITLVLRANLVEVQHEERQQLFVEEEWQLERPAGQLSPTPGVARALGCPACGATVALRADGRCTHCEQAVAAGAFSWCLHSRRVRTREPIPPPGSVAAGAEEVGTARPTVYASDLEAGLRRLGDLDPGFSFEAFQAFARASFLALQEAWGTADLDRLRGLETDSLFATHRFWLERYRQAGIRNRLLEPEVEAVGLSRVEVDAFYQSLTVRMRAAGTDVFLDAAGERLGGGPAHRRTFSEYWTFLRTGGARGAHAGDVARCPACGAPRDRIGARGVCGYCEARIVGGEHDWILSRIEQDEEVDGAC